MARQQPIELFMPPNMLKAKVGGSFGGHRHGRDQARRDGDGSRSKANSPAGPQDDVRTLVAAREAFAAKPGCGDPRRACCAPPMT